MQEIDGEISNSKFNTLKNCSIQLRKEEKACQAFSSFYFEKIIFLVMLYEYIYIFL